MSRLLAFWCPASPPCSAEALSPTPVLGKGCISSVCVSFDSGDFFRIHVSAPLGAPRAARGPEGSGVSAGPPTQVESGYPQFSGSDLHSQAATSCPVALDGHFSPPFCISDKTTKQMAHDSPGE